VGVIYVFVIGLMACSVAGIIAWCRVMGRQRIYKVVEGSVRGLM